MTEFTKITVKLEQCNNISFTINFLGFGTIHLLVGIHWILHEDPN